MSESVAKAVLGWARALSADERADGGVLFGMGEVVGAVEGEVGQDGELGGCLRCAGLRRQAESTKYRR